MFWWLMFAASAACLIAWAWTGRYRPAAALFVLAYVASLLVPHNVNDPHWWRSTWPWITGVLLPLRVCMVVEASWRLMRSVPEKWLPVAGALAGAVAVVLILLPFQRLGFDYWSFLAVRQYAQIAMAVFMGLLVLYAEVRPIRSAEIVHAAILWLLLMDYAVASTFDARTGLAGGFLVITTSAWHTARAVSNVVLALSLFLWTALAYREAKAPSRETE